MELLQQWLEGSTFPVLTAFLLGLLTSISPCPLATNKKKRAAVFLPGVLRNEEESMRDEQDHIVFWPA